MKSNNAQSRLDKHTKTKKGDPAILKAENSPKINDQILDPDLKQKVNQLMELTECTQDNAILALHDSDNDVQAAVLLLIDSNNDMQVGWKEQKGKNKKKQPPTAPVTSSADADEEFPAEAEVDERNEGNRERSYPRNAPPRMQRTSRVGQADRRFGDRGRARGRGRGRGGFSREGGFGGRGDNSYSRNRGSDNHASGDQPDMAAPQIGTWTSEADANPKTDSWGDVWSEEDNQWQGDLKGTHVFESSAKPEAFPTPTEFDPSAVAAMPPTTASVQTPGVNGSANQPTTTTASMNLDAMFPKQPVETLNPSSISMYDNQLASDSIKSAIGMPTQQQLADEASKVNKAATTQSVGAGSSLNMQSTQPLNKTGMGAAPQRGNRQQRAKVPPPSNKIPTAPVEMPHTPSSSLMSQLGVQFGAMDLDFTNDSTAPTIDSSSVTGFPAAEVSSAAMHQTMSQSQAMPASLYTTVSASHGGTQSLTGPEPIPFPSSNTQTSSLPPQKSQTRSHPTSQPTSGGYHSSSGGKVSQGSHTGYSSGGGNVNSSYKPNQSSLSGAGPQVTLPSQPSDNHASPSFQTSSSRPPVSSSGNYYQLSQSAPDSRTSGGYQSATGQPGSTQSSVSSHSNQYTNSLYSSTSEQQVTSYGHYNAGASLVTSLSGASGTTAVTSHVAPVSSQSQQLSSSGRTGAKQGPPNLPPPGVTATAAGPMVPLPHSYMMGQGMPYYNQGFYNANIEDIQKYQQSMAANMPGYYDVSMSPFLQTSSMPGPAAAGSTDAKIGRIDAQSPTATQGTQSSSNQSQPTAATNTQGHQQFVSMPPAYYQHYHYPGAAVMPPGYTFQMASATQNVNMAGSNTAVYSNQQKSGGAASGAGYYQGTNNYEDMQPAHASSEYNKNSYPASKQTNNLAGSNSNTEMSTLYKSMTSTQSNPVGNIYGGQGASGYMSGHAGTAAHLIPSQHLMQSQLTAAAQDSNVGRGNQAMPKVHSKQQQYYAGSNWSN